MLAHVAKRIGAVEIFTVETPSTALLLAVAAVGAGSSALSFHQVPDGRRPIHLRARAAIEPHLRRTAVDLIHGTQGFLVPLFAQLRLRSHRPVLLASTFAAHYAWPAAARQMPYHAPDYTRQMLRGLATEWTEARLADGLTVFAEGHRAPLARTVRLPVDRVHALPNCIDGRGYTPMAPDPVALGFEAGDFVLLFSGTVFRYKGCYELLEMMRRLAPRHPRLRLAMIGPVHPRERQRIERTIRETGLGERVRLSGGRVPREVLAQQVARCHGFVFPSHLEGCPRSVIEAMACAKPIVGSRIPGVEALDPTGAFIGLSAPGDASSLTLAVQKLLDTSAESRVALGAAGRAHYLARHTPARAAVEWAELYERICG